MRTIRTISLLRACALALVTAAMPVMPAARAESSAQAGCQFVLGFATLRSLIGTATVGDCLEQEHFNPGSGNAEQRTTGGLLVWRKATGWTAFTDGYRTWANGPQGLEQRLNSERFAWEPDKVTLQLKWVGQAQFAGYYAALDQGFYKAENLDVTVHEGGPDIAAEQVVASGQAQFGIDWLASLLATREQGVPLVNIAQVFTNAGMRQLSWKDSNITSPADLRGKRVAVWYFGNEYDLLATLNKYGIDKEADLTLIQQPFDMSLLLNREVDSAAAMTYNELYQVLSAGHTVEQLNMIDYNHEGTAMPEDGIFVNAEWLNADPTHKDIAARFLRASFKGWAYCRDNDDACVEIVLKNHAEGIMTRAAQKWQMDEINKLIWGDPIDPATQIGYMQPDLFMRAADTALQFGVIKTPAGEEAYTHEIWELATR